MIGRRELHSLSMPNKKAASLGISACLLQGISDIWYPYTSLNNTRPNHLGKDYIHVLTVNRTGVFTYAEFSLTFAHCLPTSVQVSTLHCT